MIDCVNAIKDIFISNGSINHIFIGDYEDFVAESYPAICIQPDQDVATLEEGCGYDYDDVPRLNVYYVDKAPENRDKTAFIQKMDALKETLKNNPTLNNTINSGANFVFAYSKKTMEDNIEFITKISIEGRHINGNW